MKCFRYKYGTKVKIDLSPFETETYCPHSIYVNRNMPVHDKRSFTVELVGWGDSGTPIAKRFSWSWCECMLVPVETDPCSIEIE